MKIFNRILKISLLVFILGNVSCDNPRPQPIEWYENIDLNRFPFMGEYLDTANCDTKNGRPTTIYFSGSHCGKSMIYFNENGTFNMTFSFDCKSSYTSIYSTPFFCLDESPTKGYDLELEGTYEYNFRIVEKVSYTSGVDPITGIRWRPAGYNYRTVIKGECSLNIEKASNNWYLNKNYTLQSLFRSKKGSMGIYLPAYYDQVDSLMIYGGIQGELK